MQFQTFEFYDLCGMEERLDKILIQRKMVSTRTRAEKIIKEVGVKVDGKLITKAGKKFSIDCVIEMVEGRKFHGFRVVL